MNIWRGGDSTKGARDAEFFLRERLVRSYFSLLFSRLDAVLRVAPFYLLQAQEKRHPGLIPFSQIRHVRSACSLSPSKKKKRDHSLYIGSLFIEIMSRYYESRNARETLRCTYRYICMYMKICAALFLQFLPSFSSHSPLFSISHIPQLSFNATLFRHNCELFDTMSLIISSRVFHHQSLILIYTFFLEIYFCIVNSLHICKKVTIHYKFTFIRTCILINSNKE